MFPGTVNMRLQHTKLTCCFQIVNHEIKRLFDNKTNHMVQLLYLMNEELKSLLTEYPYDG